MNLIQAIDNWAELSPDRKTFIHREEAINYKQLRERSDALAVWIINNFPDDRLPIIVYGHKQLNMLSCFLGCIKAGHAYIPIDEAIPLDRIIKIVNNSGSNLILSPTTVPENLKTGKARVLEENSQNSDQLTKIFSTFSGKQPDPKWQVKDDENFYIMYTSGSTGDPKGVQITFNCLSSFLDWAQTEFKIESNQVFLNQALFSFDLSVMDIYLSMINGGTTRCIDKQMIANPRELFGEFSKAYDINIWVSTPSFIQVCLIEKSFTQEMFPHLRTFLFCGEVLTNQTAQKLIERFSSARIFNTYGPTEATVAITSVQIDQQMVNDYSPIPVGYCKPDCTIKIIDDKGLTLPDGEKGEVVIIGPSVSPGYYQNPELTKRSFYNDFHQGQLTRAYKIGDLGYLKNNLLFYCGRLDFQIKLHGYRIELEDIEQNLRSLENVVNAVVLPVYFGEKCEYLTAFLVLEQEVRINDLQIVTVIKKQLSSKVPEYMIPRKIVIKDTLPMNPNGKVNRKELMEELISG